MSTFVSLLPWILVIAAPAYAIGFHFGSKLSEETRIEALKLSKVAREIIAQHNPPTPPHNDE